MGLNWNNELSSGIDAIDEQHRQILELATELKQLSQSMQDPDLLIVSLIQLSKTIQDHFDFEEALLSNSDYKGLNRHKADHNEISETLDAILDSVMIDESNFKPEMLNSVIAWFEEHLLKEDVKFFKKVNFQTSVDWQSIDIHFINNLLVIKGQEIFKSPSEMDSINRAIYALPSKTNAMKDWAGRHLDQNAAIKLYTLLPNDY